MVTEIENFTIDIPDNIARIVKDHSDGNLNDIAQATKEAEKSIRKLPEFPEFKETLIYLAIRALIYAARHKRIVEDKREFGYYAKNGKPKTIVGNSEEVRESHRSLYDYVMNGHTIGEMTGDEIDGYADSEDEKAKGHQFNAALARWFKSQGVIGDKRVRDVIPEARLEKNFKRIYRQHYQIEYVSA